jgi:hypothetical protein
MNRKVMFCLFVLLVFPLLACQVTYNNPQSSAKLIPETSEEIVIPIPADQSQSPELTLQFGAGNITINPGAQENLVEGTAVYNVSEYKPVITTNGNKVTLSDGDKNLNFPSTPRIVNDWDLKLSSVPMDLEIFAGGYQGDFEFGGLSLQNLRISEGGSQTNLSFSSPNNASMETFRYETGASQVKLEGLGNANFQNMIFNSGAGEYTLDFSGELKQDANVNIKSGLSSVTLIVPQDVQAKIVVDGGMMNVDYSGEWKFSGGEYTLDGTGPTLTFNIDMGAGTLVLKTQ